MDNARKRKVLAQTCVDELRKDLDIQNAANAQTNNPQPAAAVKKQALTRFLAAWQAQNSVPDANIDALRLVLESSRTGTTPARQAPRRPRMPRPRSTKISKPTAINWRRRRNHG